MDKKSVNRLLIQGPALVVDDDPTLRNIHQAHLRKKGLTTTSAINGKDVVDLFRRGASFNLVLTDLEMPIMDGIQATKELRSMNVKSIIVGITGCDSDDAVQKFSNSGLDYCLNKPLNAKKVDTIIKLLDVTSDGASGSSDHQEKIE